MKFSVEEKEVWPDYSLRPDERGIFSLSQSEYEEYLAVRERYDGWQARIGSLKPDGYVGPTKEQIEIDRKIDADLNSIEYKISLQSPLDYKRE